MTASVGQAPGSFTTIHAIALNTFREAIRDRILYLLLVFAMILIGVSRLLSLLTVGDEAKIIKDVGLSAISIFGVMTAVFVGVSLLFKEIERRTIYTLLASPVARWQFVCGKFAGLLAVLAMNVLLMSLALFGLLLVRGESPWPLTVAVVLILVELSIVTAFSLLFSSLTNPVLAAVSTAAIYVAGHMVWALKMFQDKLSEGPATWIFDALYWALPNLDRLDVKSEAVHGMALQSGFLLSALAYGIAYAAAVLVLACIAFERKEFQ